MGDEKPIGAFICSRGRRQREPCTVPGCRGDGVVLCDFVLRGPKAGRTCDRRVCRGHAKNVGPDKDYCPVHAKMHEAGVAT